MSGTVHVERCAGCGHVQYPARRFCAQCLSADVTRQAIADRAELLSATRLHASLEPGLRPYLPLDVVSVKLTAGPVAIAYLRGAGARPGEMVKLCVITDPLGREVLVAQAEHETSGPELFGPR